LKIAQRRNTAPLPVPMLSHSVTAAGEFADSDAAALFSRRVMDRKKSD
jgi:hypothetical protein